MTSETTVKSESSPKSFFVKATELVACSAAIYFCFIVYGLVHEKIYSNGYGPNKEKFTLSLFLVWFQTIGNGIFALLLLIGRMLFVKKPMPHVRPTSYFFMAFSFIGAMFASNLALKYMSYPAQALAKSSKMVPVFLMRMFVNKKKYTLREYIQVGLISAGIMLFMVAQLSEKKVGKETSFLGLALCFVSLALDAYTNTSQEKMNDEVEPSVAQMMFFINFWAFWIVAVGLVVTGQMWEGLAFCHAYPEIIHDGMIFGLMSAMGQAVILLTLQLFNSLVATTITTTRKFFTILASVVMYGHVLNFWQWTGVGMVFLGLTLEILEKYEKHRRPHHHHHSNPVNQLKKSF